MNDKPYPKKIQIGLESGICVQNGTVCSLEIQSITRQLSYAHCQSTEKYYCAL